MREAAHDRRGQLGAERIELLEAPLEVLALGLEIGEPLLLRLVLLPRKRIDLPECHPPRLEPLGPHGELAAVVAFRRLDVARSREAPGRVTRLGVDAGDLDLCSSQCGTCLVELLAQADFGRPQRPQLLAGLTGPRRARVDPGAKRSLEALRDPASRVDAVAERRGQRYETAERVRIDRRGAQSRRASESSLGGSGMLRRLLCA